MVESDKFYRTENGYFANPLTDLGLQVELRNTFSKKSDDFFLIHRFFVEDLYDGKMMYQFTGLICSLGHFFLFLYDFFSVPIRLLFTPLLRTLFFCSYRALFI